MASALLMWVVLLIIYPYYQYYIDPDGIPYLTITRFYAAGDMSRAVNGYWAPWSCWLSAMLVKAGIQLIPAANIINALGAACLLFITQSLLLHVHINRRLQWVLNISLALFLCFAVFWQSFDDLWEYFFLLTGLRIMLSPRFKDNPLLWVLLGVTGALGYFAKSYGFPFFILNTCCCVWFICKNDKGKWLGICFTSLSVMLCCSMPWMVAIHHKYGIWTSSTAGPLNMAWFVAGHPYWKPGIELMVPPPYPNSPSYWEDPYLANGPTPHFWDSLYLFGREMLRVVYNIYKFIRSILELSILFPFIMWLAFAIIGSKKVRSLFTHDVYIIALSFLLFPLGYLPVNYESRHIWYMLPLGMLLGAAAWQQGYFTKRRAGSLPILLLCGASFIIFPFITMCQLFNEGKEQYTLAPDCPQGSFTSNALPGKEMHRINRLAFFSGNSYYTIPLPGISEKDLLAEMNKYHVKYYYYICRQPADSTYVLKDSNGQQYPSSYINGYHAIKIFTVNP